MTPRSIVTTIFITCASAIVSALTLDEAKQAFASGDYAEAIPVLTATADKEPKNSAVNQMAGIALFYTGNENEAKKYLERGQHESNLFLARISFNHYDFDSADEYLDRYEKACKKARKDPSEEFEIITDLVSKGRSMLDRVEKIVVIDSIAVDREDFMKHYRLSKPAGSVSDISVLPEDFEAADPSSVYLTENRETMIWVAPDSVENFCLVGSTRLADGSWEKPHPLGDVLNEGGDANYPFLMSDGVTLYFANDGENSLGGYDIFISRLDGDSFLQPQNIGMPYNSPYDDYLLAIDEITGVGWWATDRNRLDDKITIYRFIPQELRINYPVDQANLPQLALIENFHETWPENADYSELLDRIDQLGSGNSRRSDTFRFAMPGGRVFTSLSDFKSPTAASLMKDYLGLEQKIEHDRKRLESLRRDYGAGNKSLAAEIMKLESEITRLREELGQKRNDIVRAEQ